MYVCMYVYINEQNCSTVLVLSRACYCWIKLFDVGYTRRRLVRAFEFERSSCCFGFVRPIFGGEWSEIYRYSYDSSEMITYLFFTLGIYLLVPLYHDPCVHLKIVWMILKCHGLGQRVTADRLESASNVVGL